MRKKNGKQWLESSDTFIFSLFSLRTFESCSVWTEQKFILVLSGAVFENFLQIFRSYGISFLVFSFFCCLEKAVTFVAYHDKSCDQNRYSVEQANQARSAKFEKTGIVMSFFNIVSRVTYEKYANLR